VTPFVVRIPGEPASINRLKVIRRYRSTASGTVGYPAIGKPASVEQYQHDATLLVKAGRPSGWKWAGGYLRVIFRAHLKRHIDGDNFSKILGDAIAAAIGVDDRWFLICVAEIVIGPEDPYVEIAIRPEGEGGRCHCIDAHSTELVR
jgi:hypothetical protein